MALSEATDRAAVGQRWVSETEPDLGLGVIESAEGGWVGIFFPAAQERRLYAMASAPLRRAKFRIGDRLQLAKGDPAEIGGIEEEKGCVIYLLKGKSEVRLHERELPSTLTFSQPQDRLCAGRVDELELWDLRAEAWLRLAAWHRSPERGLIGPRVGLIPHQLAIASEATRRLAPRVLLADEVGLGKTIEAGLIIHQLYHTGRATRVLILVPEPLVNQWFVEMLRRFNLLFSLYDEERCIATEPADSAGEEELKAFNPFAESSLVLCAVEWLAGDQTRAAQVAAAGWDVVVVDEAHRIGWTPEAASPAYELVEKLATSVPSLLLLTATPQQLGPEGHFARLRLLDPARYSDLPSFLQESEHYHQVAQAIDRLDSGQALRAQDKKVFSQASSRVRDLLAGSLKSKEDREAVVEALADEFGPGRVMFRHTRRLMKGFPARLPHLVKIEPTEEADTAKLHWLESLIASLKGEKVLVIGKTRELAEALSEGLRSLREMKIGLFHEGLTLLQRDRNAAWFAEPEGAQILICSEIGSEGRNFQFAHHLVLIDLPNDPDVLEQRIGRLDRIGQTGPIHLHIPWIPGTESEVLARWFDEGLEAFSQSLRGGAEMAAELAEERDQCLKAAHEGNLSAAKLDSFLKRSQTVRERVTAALAQGIDRLLARQAKPSSETKALISHLKDRDESEAYPAFALRLFDHFGLHREQHSARCYVLGPGQHTTNTLPGLPDEGLTGTFDRPQALSRDDIAFLSEEHPLIRGGIEMLLSSTAGNAATAHWAVDGPEALLLECRFIVDCAAPSWLQADRWLPPTPHRCVFDHTGKDWSHEAALAKATLLPVDLSAMSTRPAFAQQFIPKWLTAAEASVSAALPKLAKQATSAMSAFYEGEIARLTALSAHNTAVSPAEIKALQDRQQALAHALAGVRFRLDAVRLILKRKA